MIDAAKYADLVLLMIDGGFGFEMETFEFLNILQASRGLWQCALDGVQTTCLRSSRTLPASNHLCWHTNLSRKCMPIGQSTALAAVTAGDSYSLISTRLEGMGCLHCTTSLHKAAAGSLAAADAWLAGHLHQSAVLRRLTFRLLDAAGCPGGVDL